MTFTAKVTAPIRGGARCDDLTFRKRFQLSQCFCMWKEIFAIAKPSLTVQFHKRVIICNIKISFHIRSSVVLVDLSAHFNVEAGPSVVAPCFFQTTSIMISGNCLESVVKNSNDSIYEEARFIFHQS